MITLPDSARDSEVKVTVTVSGVSDRTTCRNCFKSNKFHLQDLNSAWLQVQIKAHWPGHLNLKTALYRNY